jgi:D-alanine-D-alanine ligase
MKRVVVLYGGKSGEHEVSRISAAGVVRHLDPGRFEAVLVGISTEGAWSLQRRDLVAEARGGLASLPVERGPAVLAAPASGLFIAHGDFIEPLPCDLVFPVLHGTFGEDGTVQGLLETIDLPYVGASVLGSAIGMDKEKTKNLWRERGLPCLDHVVARKRDLEAGRLSALVAKVDARLGWPIFVKPVSAGSSVGAGVVKNAEDLRPALLAAFEWDERALMEPLCHAREIECSVLGNTGSGLRAFPPGEVVPTHEFYDYEAKYIDPNGARLQIPAAMPAELSDRIMSMAMQAFECLDLAGMARVDFFLERKTGALYLNEVNTIPGFTSISMYPKMCEAGGLAYPDLLSRLADLAFERHEARHMLRFAPDR